MITANIVGELGKASLRRQHSSREFNDEEPTIGDQREQRVQARGMVGVKVLR